MKTLDIAVVGSGIGGTLISSLNKDKNIVMFEQDKNLGGCASTFKRFGSYFNTGATTFVGYEKNHPVKTIFDKSNIVPNIKKSEVAIRVIQEDKILDRVKNFDLFLENLNKTYPHKNNQIFWQKLKEIDEKFWQLKNIYFEKYSFFAYMKTAGFVIELFKVFGLDILKSADDFIKQYLPNVDQSYKDFLNSQLLITVQTTYENISLLSLALGLCYPFHDVFYVNGGMGNIIEDIVKDIEVKRKERVEKIVREKNNFIIKTTKDTYKSENVILNSSLYQSSKLFEDKDIQKYYEQFSFSDQSAFVVYMKLNIKKEFLHHYQIILKKNIPNSISNSFFISFSDKDDEVLSKDGLSITISTHTKASFWKNLSKEQYKKYKEITQEFIVQEFFNYFQELNYTDVNTIFSATSTTFNNYIARYNCGGKAINFQNISQLASGNTPFKGLYNVGDTVFAGQGWPGVALGVTVLDNIINS